MPKTLVFTRRVLLNTFGPYPPVGPIPVLRAESLVRVPWSLPLVRERPVGGELVPPQPIYKVPVLLSPRTPRLIPARRSENECDGQSFGGETITKRVGGLRLVPTTTNHKIIPRRHVHRFQSRCRDTCHHPRRESVQVELRPDSRGSVPRSDIPSTGGLSGRGSPVWTQDDGPVEGRSGRKWWGHDGSESCPKWGLHLRFGQGPCVIKVVFSV